MMATQGIVCDDKSYTKPELALALGCTVAQLNRLIDEYKIPVIGKRNPQLISGELFNIAIREHSLQQREQLLQEGSGDD